ncbi:hypothetical protein SprV_0100100400 [Sparganum proliferum]
MRHEVKTPERPEDRPSEGTDENSSNNSSISDNEDAEYLAQGYTLLNTPRGSTSSSDVSDEESVPEQLRRPSTTDTGGLEAANCLDTGFTTSRPVSSNSTPNLDSELYKILESDRAHGSFPVQKDIPDESSPALLWNSRVPSEISEIPMTEEKVKQIKACFADFRLPETNLPSWAKTFPEDAWKEELLMKLRMSKNNNPCPNTLRLSTLAAMMSPPILAARNVLSKQLGRRTALVARDIAALSETQFSKQAHLEEVDVGYIIQSDRPKAGRRNASFSLAIRKDIVGRLLHLPQGINDRLTNLHLPLRRTKFATIISTYARPPCLF